MDLHLHVAGDIKFVFAVRAAAVVGRLELEGAETVFSFFELAREMDTGDADVLEPGGILKLIRVDLD